MKLLNKINVIETFHDKYVIPEDTILVYRILFQAANLSESSFLSANQDFNKIVRKYFLENKIDSLGISYDKLGDQLKLLVPKFDFSADNIQKLNEIMEKSNTKLINSSIIGKIDKIAGLISFFIKDVLLFSGLMAPETDKVLHSHSSRERLQNLGDLKEFTNQISKTKMVVERLQIFKKKLIFEKKIDYQMFKI